MFLRRNKRLKDGKEHRYWSGVENRRVSAKRTFQKILLYLGEINDCERASWTRAIDAINEKVVEDSERDQWLSIPVSANPLLSRVGQDA